MITALTKAALYILTGQVFGIVRGPVRIVLSGVGKACQALRAKLN
jgi:hypothetical protein